MLSVWIVLPFLMAAIAGVVALFAPDLRRPAAYIAAVAIAVVVLTPLFSKLAYWKVPVPGSSPSTSSGSGTNSPYASSPSVSYTPPSTPSSASAGSYNQPQQVAIPIPARPDYAPNSDYSRPDSTPTSGSKPYNPGTGNQSPQPYGGQDQQTSDTDQTQPAQVQYDGDRVQPSPDGDQSTPLTAQSDGYGSDQQTNQPAEPQQSAPPIQPGDGGTSAGVASGQGQ